MTQNNQNFNTDITNDITNNPIYKKIIHAIESNNLFEVQKHIQEGFDINADNGYFLQKASHKGYLPIIQFLIEEGADISLKESLAFKWATREGHLEVIQFFIEHNVHIPHYKNYFTSLIKQGDITTIKILFDTQDYKSQILNNINEFFISSSCYHNTEVTAFLVEQGADIHLDNEAALKNAIEYNSPETVRYLINKGADIYIKEDHLLSNAVYYKNFTALTYLIEAHKNNLYIASREENDEYKDYMLIANEYFELEKTRALQTSVENLDVESFDYLIKEKTNIYTPQHSIFKSLIKEGPHSTPNAETLYHIADYFILNYADKKTKYLTSTIETAYRYKHIEQNQRDFWINYVNSLLLNKKLNNTLIEDSSNHIKKYKL